MENNQTRFKTEQIYQSMISLQEKNEVIKKMANQAEWMKRQLEYMIYSLSHKVKYNLRKGDILEIDWGVNVNAEFSNRHYGVVLLDSNENNPLVLVCPLKSNHKGAHPKSDLDLGIIEGLKHGTTTLAVINQIRMIDKMRIYVRKIINGKECENDNLTMPKIYIDKIINSYKLLVEGRLS